jgi:hypothetical protein
MKLFLPESMQHHTKNQNGDKQMPPLLLLLHDVKYKMSDSTAKHNKMTMMMKAQIIVTNRRQKFTPHP